MIFTCPDLIALLCELLWKVWVGVVEIADPQQSNYAIFGNFRDPM